MATVAPATSASAAPGDITTFAGSPPSTRSPEAVAVRGSSVYVVDTGRSVVQVFDSVTGVESVVAGTGVAGYSGDGGKATLAHLNRPRGVTADSAGNVYIADTENNRVRKVAPDGTITTVAGTGVAGYSGDSGSATSAQLRRPVAVAVDGSSPASLYIGDSDNHVVRKVVPTGTITTVAGTGEGGYSGDNGAATSARLAFPYGVAVAGDGTMYIADTGTNRVRRVSPSGTITSVVTNPALVGPRGVAVDGQGTLHIADTGNHTVWKIVAGRTERVAGTGTAGDGGDGGLASLASLNKPTGVAASSDGTVFIADSANNRVRKVDRFGMISTVSYGGSGGSFGGDGGPARRAGLSGPGGLSFDSARNLYIADIYNNRIRKVDPGGTITTVAGTGEFGYGGDGGKATSAQIAPAEVLADCSATLYISDSYNNRVRKVTRDGVITTFAGDGTPAYGGDGGPAVAASLNFPQGLLLDGSGNLYIGDSDNHRVRKITPAGTITTVAGTGVAGYGGDGGQATSASLNFPEDLAFDGGGNLYVSDAGNHRIRKVTPGGTITTVAGTGVAGYGGDGGAATSAKLNFPEGLVFDSAGNLFVADSDNNRVRRITPGGTITTVAGTGVAGFAGEGGPASSATLSFPEDVTLDASGNLYVSDLDNDRVRVIEAAAPTPPTLSVSDAAPVAEGTGAAGQSGSARFTVSLSSAATTNLRVCYTTADGTATGTASGTGTGGDYKITSGTLTFAPGQVSRVVEVPVTMDSSAAEADEDFFLDVSGPSAGVGLADGRGKATIVNDDPTSSATLSVNDVTVMESTAGTPTQAIFTVSLSKPYAAPFSVRAFTADGTAHPPPHQSNDYVQLNQTINFAAQETSKQVAVTINGDNVAERDEIFYLALEDSTGPQRAKRQGVGTIIDDDNFPTVSIDDVTLTEGHSGTKEARFTVALSHSSFRVIDVGYATTDGTARGTSHATFGASDYIPVMGTLRFIPGETTKSVVVAVNGDTLREPDEEFFVQLPSAVNAVQAKRVGVGTIRNDD